MNEKGESRPVLGLVFLTVFLDMVGFSVIFPLFPAMLDHYVGLEGEESLVGRLAETLASWAGRGTDTERFAVIAFFGGLLGSLYSLLQFLFAPIWGALSDQRGRRTILLVTLAGTALSYVAWFFAGSFAVLVVARLLGGIMAGNISIASAAIADTHSGRDRAKGMGVLGAGIGLGFVVGPALGGFASEWNLAESWPGGVAYGVNPFSGCALVAFALAMLNLVWAARRFPETLPPERRGARAGERTLHPFRAVRSIAFPGVARTIHAYFLYFGAFGAMEFTLTFLAVERLGFRPRQNAWMFVFVGLVIAFVQGGLVRRLAPKYGERRLAVTGMALTIPGFVIVGLTQTVGLLYTGLAFLAFGSALVMPSLSSLVSRYTPDDRQGLALGIFRSMGSLARAIGPILGGVLYWKLGSWGPYYIGAGVLLLPVCLALGLPPVHEAAGGGEPDQAPGSKGPIEES